MTLSDESLNAWLSLEGNHVLDLEDPRFPVRLRELPDPPTRLFAKGNLSLLERPSLAIVGSRNATRQGCMDAEAFAESLADAGLVIVSGLAEGIDAAAHLGGLRGNSGTIAVMATGADRVYPPHHRELAHRIAKEGLVLTEYPLGTSARKWQFPERNRLIAGLSLGCLVIEAGLSSGSLITAKLSLEQGREVFALPGSIHSPLSKGCHRLIREGAKLVETANDVLEELKFQVPAKISTEMDPGDSDSQILKELASGPLAIDQIVARTGLTAGQVSLMLTSLELEGRVECLPGGRYQRLSAHAG